MKNNPLCLVALAFTILLAAGLRAAPLADARARYADGEYAQAEKLFEQALESSPPQAAVFFELGRCLRQTGQEARAALCFRRALVLDPRFTPARLALLETNTDLGLPKFPKIWKDHVLERIPMDALTLAGTVFFWLGAFAVMLLAFLRASNGKGWFALGILCLVGGAAALALAGICDPRITDRTTALVLKTGGSSLLSSPADQSEKTAALPDGGTVTILSQRGRWFYGRLPDGKCGWFLTEGIVPLIPPA
ncbi:MAG: tetratricopeptide repeat protein [Verrucomicrobiae bacterium]